MDATPSSQPLHAPRSSMCGTPVCVCVCKGAARGQQVGVRTTNAAPADKTDQALQIDRAAQCNGHAAAPRTRSDAPDDAAHAERELELLAAVAAAVELLAVAEGARVVHPHDLAARGLVARALGHDRLAPALAALGQRLERLAGRLRVGVGRGGGSAADA